MRATFWRIGASVGCACRTPYSTVSHFFVRDIRHTATPHSSRIVFLCANSRIGYPDEVCCTSEGRVKNDQVRDIYIFPLQSTLVNFRHRQAMHKPYAQVTINVQTQNSCVPVRFADTLHSGFELPTHTVRCVSKCNQFFRASRDSLDFDPLSFTLTTTQDVK